MVCAGSPLSISDAVHLMKLGALDVVASDQPAQAIRNIVANIEIETPPALDPGAGDVRRMLSKPTVRERRVFEGLMSGGTNKMIAQKLGLGPRTVETHRAHLMDRLNFANLA